MKEHMNHIKIVQTLEKEFVIEFQSGYTINIPKTQFDSLFDKVDDEYFKLKNDIDSSTDAQLEELQEICFYSLSCKEYENTEYSTMCLKAFVEVAKEFCNKYKISESLFFSSLKTVEISVTKNLIKSGIHFDSCKHIIPEELVDKNKGNKKSFKDLLEKRFNTVT